MLRRRPRATVRMAGRPTSANGASSFHLWWQLPPGDGSPVVAMSATLEILIPPSRPVLQFWALQVGFEAGGRTLGAGHTGLQCHPRAPEGALNWGGYDAGGRELAGTVSSWPGVDSANTVRWPWEAGRPYRFTVSSPAPGRWRSEVTDLVDGRHTIIRDLEIDAAGLTAPVVWTEAFARCEDPSTVARWSRLQARRGDGQVITPTGLVATYQAFEAGGCANTEARPDGPAVVQVTGLAAPRTERSGHLIPYAG